VDKPRLDPEELVVSSFDTTAAESYAIARPTTLTDPTAQTYCFVCPVYTENCY
jgi:hypothetical protein